jgi:NAD(P)-dependent dehydrogenase (short-subunit alcohol dehydrogenase family)
MSGGVVELPEEEWDRIFAVNLKGCFLTMKHVIPIMEKQGGGWAPQKPLERTIRSRQLDGDAARGFNGHRARVNTPCEFLGTCSNKVTALPSRSQHTAAKKGVIQRQSDDCADCGDASAVKGIEIKASQPAATKLGEEPPTDNRANDAEEHIDDGSFARGADDLAGDQPQH